MKNIDLDLLNELIQKCEAKMASPFRKKKESMEGLGASSDEESEDSEEPAAAALIVEKKEEMPEDEMDMEALMDLYKKIKA
jgi:hypothetical protein